MDILRKWYYLVFVVVLVGAVGILTTLAYWTIPVNPLVINHLPVPASLLKPRPGEIIQLTFNYCKNTSSQGRVVWYLVSADPKVAPTVLLPYMDTTPTGCKVLNAPMIIPEDVSPGTYHYHYKITYDVNPIQEKVVEFDTATFEVQ